MTAEELNAKHRAEAHASIETLLSISTSMKISQPY